MYKTVIFDLDGTLLNTIGDLAAAGNEVCRRHGWKTYSEAEFQTMVGHGMANLVKRFVPEEEQTEEFLASILLEYTTYYGAHSCERTAPYPGVPELLCKLKAAGVQLAVFSNKNDEPSRQLVAHYFPGTFSLVRGKLPDVPVKPDPAGTRLVLEALGADIAETLYVGDSNVDIRTGHNAGLKSCGVSWGFRPRQTLVEASADYLADTAEELEQILLG